MPDLRVAIIGYGLAGRFFHAPLIAATEGLAVASIVTANPARRAEAAHEHPGARLLGSADELWSAGETRSAGEAGRAAGDGPDLVVVATPNEAHAPLARVAIEHGVPVVVDKPLAVDAVQAADLVARAEAAGVLLTVFQNRRWDSDQLTLRRLLEEDALGEVRRFESRFERWHPEPDPSKWRETVAPEQGGGVLLDLGPHLVDQALVLFGPVTHVYAEVEAWRGQPGDDDAFLALRHAGGVVSHLHASVTTPAPAPRLRVQGTRAAFLVQGVDPQEAALRAGARPDTVGEWGRGERYEQGRLIAGERSVPVQGVPGDWPRFYALLAAALRDGGAPPVDPRDAVAALRVIEAARVSSRERRVVALDEFAAVA